MNGHFLNVLEVTVENSDCFLVSVGLFFLKELYSLCMTLVTGGPGTPGMSCITGYCRQQAMRIKVAGPAAAFLHETQRLD